MLPMSVARSSAGMLTIGRIAHRREGVTGLSVIYDCLVGTDMRLEESGDLNCTLYDIDIISTFLKQKGAGTRF